VYPVWGIRRIQAFLLFSCCAHGFRQGCRSVWVRAGSLESLSVHHVFLVDCKGADEASMHCGKEHTRRGRQACREQYKEEEEFGALRRTTATLWGKRGLLQPGCDGSLEGPSCDAVCVGGIGLKRGIHQRPGVEPMPGSPANGTSHIATWMRGWHGWPPELWRLCGSNHTPERTWKVL
jgi:hypothetical protein